MALFFIWKTTPAGQLQASKLLPTLIFKISILVKNLVGEHVSKTHFPKKSSLLDANIVSLFQNLSFYNQFTIQMVNYQKNSLIFLSARFKIVLCLKYDSNYLPLFKKDGFDSLGKGLSTEFRFGQ